jgi:hypothetical protein
MFWVRKRRRCRLPHRQFFSEQFAQLGSEAPGKTVYESLCTRNESGSRALSTLGLSLVRGSRRRSMQLETASKFRRKCCTQQVVNPRALTYESSVRLRWLVIGPFIWYSREKLLSRGNCHKKDRLLCRVFHFLPNNHRGSSTRRSIRHKHRCAELQPARANASATQWFQPSDDGNMTAARQTKLPMQRKPTHGTETED